MAVVAVGHHPELTAEKAMESECKFRELDLKIQWGLASRLEVAKAAYYVSLSTECMEEFNKSFKRNLINRNKINKGVDKRL